MNNDYKIQLQAETHCKQEGHDTKNENSNRSGKCTLLPMMLSSDDTQSRLLHDRLQHHRRDVIGRAVTGRPSSSVRLRHEMDNARRSG